MQYLKLNIVYTWKIAEHDGLNKQVVVKCIK